MTSPVTSPMEPEGSKGLWVEPQQQLGAYVAWVNSQLKKKSGFRLIEDLRNDMRDGVVFADIIDIMAKEKVSGITEVPGTYEEMRDNVDRVLHFMVANRIKMHRIHSSDIVEGNLKAIMRLILALAAHYKPMSVRHSTSSRSSSRRQSVIDIAQGASAALTEARRNAKKAGKRRSRLFSDPRNPESTPEPSNDGDNYSQQADWSRPSPPTLLTPPPSWERRELEGCSGSSSPASSCRASPRSSLHLPDGLTFTFTGLEGETMSLDSGLPTGADDSQLETISALKKQLLQLQDLMMSSTDSGMEVEGEGVSVEEGVLLRSQVQHVTMVNDDLRQELSRLRNDCLQLQGTKAGLQQRLGEQDSMLSQLKSEKLQLEIQLQTVSAENSSLRQQLALHTNSNQGGGGNSQQSKDTTISYLRGELSRRDRTISRLHQEISLDVPDTSSVQLRPHLQASPSSSSSSTTPHPAATADVSSLRDAVQKMRTTLTTSSPQFPALSQLETEVSGLLNVLRSSKFHSSSGVESGEREAPTHRVPSTAVREAGGPQTSVVYFTDDSAQPNVCVISGRLGEIRLRDLKQVVKNSDDYRYYFKSLDPEYGTVKEELTQEEAVLPGWENKIVAWLETELGTPC